MSVKLWDFQTYECIRTLQGTYVCVCVSKGSHGNTCWCFEKNVIAFNGSVVKMSKQLLKTYVHTMVQIIEHERVWLWDDNPVVSHILELKALITVIHVSVCK